MKILGYKYTAEQQAQQARKQCADYYGLPQSKEDITQYWVDYQCSMLDEPKFWYILFHDSLTVVLGDPTEFEVATNDS